MENPKKHLLFVLCFLISAVIVVYILANLMK